MPSFCAVLDCVDKYGHGKSMPFHKFPTKNKERLEKWINFTQRPKDWQPSRWMSICGLHFREEDYRCLEHKKLLKKTAIPSVRTSKTGKETISNETPETEINELEKELTPCTMGTAARNNSKPNINCRFCDNITTNFKSFAGNFEIFGVIQKCLPTLSICQDDNLPKEICSKCLKQLENFAHFIDKVLETQATLLRRFRHEKSSVKATERALKIKQEPVVRVKQEKQENLDDVNAFFPDEVDDGNEVENDASNTDSQLEQKYEYCDFPVLNDQDLINNCDIMEIINLSDPFIDITNCENTIAEEEQQQQRQGILTRHNIDNTKTISPIPTTQIRQLQTAHELLQSHLLIEEHNYAYSAEDFKEEWQIKNCYKTEKIEADENVQDEQHTTMNCIVTDNEPNFNDIIDDGTTVAALTTVETTLLPTNEIERSVKPIVTSISSFNDTYPQATNFSTLDPQLQQQQQQIPQITSRKRPNIVVLNESIVQSSHLLQACTVCQSKFIGIDSLNHHYKTAHNTMSTTLIPTSSTTTLTNPTTCTPMVTVPTANIVTTSETTATTWNNFLPQNCQPSIQIQSCKIEKDIGFESNQLGTQINEFHNSMPQSEEIINVQYSNKRSSKNEIKILDNISFAQHQYSTNYSNLIQFDQRTFSNLSPAQINSISAFPLETKQATPTTVAYTSSTPIHMPSSSSIIPNKKPELNSETSADITVKYLALQKSYERLRIKCRRLTYKTNLKKNIKRKLRFRCRICNLRFNTIFQLLRHKQTTPYHRQRRQRAYFFATCPGCEKFFCHKISLFNHMRYICQSLPLSWFKSQIRNFKCRCCRLITFTHWRLYRRHEVKCRLRKLKQMQSKKKTLNETSLNNETQQAVNFRNSSHQVINTKNFQKLKRTTPSANKRKLKNEQSAPYTCTICKKVFPTSSSLNQHHITHSNLRSFQCEICKRIFKRRNGLTQHVRGFHMKLKPFQCPICKHTYALKADMKRCKHSAMNRCNKKANKKDP